MTIGKTCNADLHKNSSTVTSRRDSIDQLLSGSHRLLTSNFFHLLLKNASKLLHQVTLFLYAFFLVLVFFSLQPCMSDILEELSIFLSSSIFHLLSCQLQIISPSPFASYQEDIISSHVNSYASLSELLQHLCAVHRRTVGPTYVCYLFVLVVNTIRLVFCLPALIVTPHMLTICLWVLAVNTTRVFYLFTGTCSKHDACYLSVYRYLR